MDRKRRRPDNFHNGFGNRPYKFPRESPRINQAQLEGRYHRQGGPNLPEVPLSFFDKLENIGCQKSVSPFLIKHCDEVTRMLNHMQLTRSEVHCLIKGLRAAAETASSKEESLSVLQLVIRSSFLERSLLCFIAILNDCDHQINRDALDNVIALLRHLTLAFPKNIQALISIPVDLLHVRLQRLQSLGSQLSWPMKKQLLDLQHAVNEVFPGEHSMTQCRMFSEEQPKDFHEISIFPRSKDMISPANPTVLPNKIKGPYESNFVYLDTHFRLVREDFVKPLREGISNCLAPRSHFVEASRQTSELRIYRKVQVLHPVCQWEGVTYKVQFNAHKFRRGVWLGCKRLMKGSLVCLLAPDCEEIFFASVAKWNAEWLSQGLILLKFSVSHAELSKLNRHQFIMVESPAFFEAYRHVLQGLQEMDVKRVPFQRYIVKCKTTVRPPAYLQQRNVSLDLRPLLRNINGANTAGAADKAEMESDLEEDVSPFEQPGLEQTLAAEECANVIEEQDGLTEDSFALPEGRVSPAERTMEAAGEKVNPSREGTQTGEEYIHLAVDSDSNMEEEHHSAAEQSFSRAEEYISITGQQLQSAVERPGPAVLTVSLTRRGTSTSPAEMSMDPIQQRGNPVGHGVNLAGHGVNPVGQSGNHLHQGDKFTEKNKYEINPFEQDFRSLRWLKHFDRSQLKALQKALTREFALIQGPPGTGKTFLGLKIVELLLHNQSLWQKNDGTMNHSPILIVCNTNHALDQFLEGILEFRCTGIVRIGGFCRNKKLQMFSLEAIRKATLQKVLTISQRCRFKELKAKIELTKAEILYCSKILERLPVGILHEEELKPEMNTDMDELGLTSLPPIKKEGSFILEWLNIPHRLWPQKGAERRMAHWRQEIESDRYFPSCPAEKSPSKEFNSRYRAYEDEDEENECDLDSSDPCDPPCSAEEWAGDKFAYIMDTDVSDNEALGIKKRLADQSIMGKKEVQNVEDVWEINLDDRWRLYRKWKLAYEAKLKASINENLNLYEKMAQDLSALNLEEDLTILKTAVVIGMTTTGAAKYRALLQNIKPRIVIIEEAAEVLEAHVLTMLTPACQHLIMIGDHKQLRPKLADYEMGAKYHLDVSLFERMVKNLVPFVPLSHQHRMRPEISQLMVPTFYSNLRDHRSVSLYEDIKGLATNIFFIQHQVDEDRSTETLSHSNEYEAQFLVGLCQHLLKQGYTMQQLTVLTPYTSQVLRIRALVRERGMAEISVKAIDDFQGEENDIVLLSLVRSNREGKIGFLKDKNRLCVAFSRAKMGFYCMGNFQNLQRSPEGQMWEKLLHLLHERGLTGEGLPLLCPNHSEGRLIVESPEDFQRIPDRVCDRPCRFRLECGHLCNLRCHLQNREHRGYRCQEICGRTHCDGGHRCPKRCWEECGPCEQTVEKIVPGCGHGKRVACSLPPEAISCDHPCKRVQDCGHKCQQQCSKNCTDFLCTAKCTEVLQCGHPCKGNCSDCIQGRLHHGCNRRCGRVLLCSHQCREPCTDSCQPCRLPCANRCEHSQCQKRCREICDPCLKPCLWKCKHHRCSRTCSEECDRPRCDQPCDRTLPCGHLCAGLCGEVCPRLCRICHTPMLTAAFFGTEGDPGARFVVLGCGDTLEVGGLDQLMDRGPSELRPLRLEACPKCKTPIFWHTRYNTAIKRRWHSINQVKSMILGSSEEIEEKKKQLTEGILAASVDRHYIEQRYDIRKKVETSQFLPELVILERALGIYKFLDVVRKQAKACSSEHRLSLELMLTRLDWWLRSKQASFTCQQLTECRNEITRISYLADLMRLLSHCEAGNAEQLGNVLRAVDPLLRNLAGKLIEDKEQIKRDLEKIGELFPCRDLWISEEERLSEGKDVAMAKGDWYQCPNDHLYAVGECDPSIDGAACPECPLMIGGESRPLEGASSQAAEVDGSSSGASSGSVGSSPASEAEGHEAKPHSKNLSP
ncbi:NFX1-type zinc finger-containing protein 1-like [Heterodontus francisci]|uniref:NFX1-type zinc finger-containing protein 1-like n=1 Tax=Heterodontus francisci TaxID=7792 RepID=UPI00355C72BB